MVITSAPLNCAQNSTGCIPSWKGMMSANPKLYNRDPFEILAVRMIKLALEDLNSNSPIRNLDALLFFLSEEAQIYMCYLGYELPEEQLFLKVLKGFEHAQNPKVDRRYLGGDRGYVSSREAQIPEGVAA
jgi:hypothetical protein